MSEALHKQRQYDQSLLKTHSKILFYRESDEYGYPPQEWESMWAEQVGKNLYRLDNIPFFARRVSCDDVVRVVMDEGVLIFDEVIEYSSNSTIRIFVFESQDVEEVQSELVRLGCQFEGTGISKLIAVNVPADAQLDQLLTYLKSGIDEHKWELEESSLRY